MARSETKCDGSPPLTGIRRERSEGAQKRREYETDLRGAGLRASTSDPGPCARMVDCGGVVLVTVAAWRS